VATIRETIIALAAAYPNFSLTPETVIVYERVLNDIDPKLLEAAVLECIANNRFFPTVAEIREKSFQLVRMANGIPSAYEAWGEVIKSCHRGKYDAGQYSHPLIKQAVDVIGIEFLSNMQIDEENTTRAHFFRIFESLEERKRVSDQMTPEVRGLIQQAVLKLTTTNILQEKTQ
jgi:hypothetical protein